MRASQPSPGRFYLLPPIAIACGGSGGPSGVRPGAWREIGDATVRLEYQDADAGISATMLEHARAGRAAAMAFFGQAATRQPRRWSRTLTAPMAETPCVGSCERTTPEALGILGVTEAALLDRWRPSAR